MQVRALQREGASTVTHRVADGGAGRPHQVHGVELRLEVGVLPQPERAVQHQQHRQEDCERQESRGGEAGGTVRNARQRDNEGIPEPTAQAMPWSVAATPCLWTGADAATRPTHDDVRQHSAVALRRLVQ